MDERKKQNYIIECETLHHSRKYSDVSSYNLVLKDNEKKVKNVKWSIKNPYSFLNIKMVDEGAFLIDIKDEAISSGQINKYKDTKGRISLNITAEAQLLGKVVATKKINILFGRNKKGLLALILSLCIGIPVIAGIAVAVIVTTTKKDDDPKPEPTPSPTTIDVSGSTSTSVEYGSKKEEQYTCTYKDQSGKEISGETNWTIVDKVNLPTGVSAKIDDNGLLTLDATTYNVVQTGTYELIVTATNKNDSSLTKSITLSINITGNITPSKTYTKITTPSDPVQVVAGGKNGASVNVEFRNQDNKIIPNDKVNYAWSIDPTSISTLSAKNINVSIDDKTGYVTVDATNYGDVNDFDFTQPGIDVILTVNSDSEIVFNNNYVKTIVTGDTKPANATITPPAKIEVTAGTEATTDPFSVEYTNAAGQTIPSEKVITTWSVDNTTFPESVDVKIDPSTGVLTIDAKNNHDVNDGTYEITIQVSDGKGYTYSQTYNATLKADIVPKTVSVSGQQNIQTTAGSTTPVEEQYTATYQNAGGKDIPSSSEIPTTWRIASIQPQIQDLDIHFSTSTTNELIVDASNCVLAVDTNVTINITAEETAQPTVISNPYQINLKVSKSADIPAYATISGDKTLIAEAGSKTAIYSNAYTCVFENAAHVVIPEAIANYYFDAAQKTTEKTLADGTVLTITADHKIKIDSSASRLAADTNYPISITAVSTQEENVSDTMNVDVTITKVDQTPVRAEISGEKNITTYAGNQTNVEETYTCKFYNKDDIELTPTTINWSLESSPTPIDGVTVNFDGITKNKLVVNSSSSRITTDATSTIQIKATDPASSVSADTYDINLSVNKFDTMPTTAQISGDTTLNIDAGQTTKVTSNAYTCVFKNKDGIVLDNEQATYTITDKTSLPTEVTADIVNNNQIQIDASQSRITTETTYPIEITATSKTASGVSSKMTVNIVVAPLSTVITRAEVSGNETMSTTCASTTPVEETYTVKYFNKYGIEVSNTNTTWSVESVTPSFASGVNAGFKTTSTTPTTTYSVDAQNCRETENKTSVVVIKATDDGTGVNDTISVTVTINKFDNVPFRAQIKGDATLSINAKAATPVYTTAYTCDVFNEAGIQLPDASVTYSLNNQSVVKSQTLADGTVVTIENDNTIKVDASASTAETTQTETISITAFTEVTGVDSSMDLVITIKANEKQPASIEISGDDVIPVLNGSTSTSAVYTYTVRDEGGEVIPESPVTWEFDQTSLPSGVSVSKTEDNKISVDASGYTTTQDIESYTITLTIKSTIDESVKASKTIYISITSSSYLPATATINGATTITVAGNRTSSVATYTATYKNASGGTIDPGFSTGTSWSIESQSFTDTGVVATIDEATGQLKIDASKATSRESQSTGTVVVRGTSTFAPTVSATSAEINIKVNPQVDGNYITYNGTTYKMVDNININTYTFGNSMGYNITVPLSTGDVTINKTTVTDLVIQTIDSSVESIPNNFAYGCSSLESVDLSGFSGLKTIGYSFMSGCSSLTDIDLSYLNGVTSIDYNFLVNCSSLSNIDLSFMSEVTSVGSQFLMGCSSLVNLDLTPLAKVETIGVQFLSGCSGLTYLDCSPLVSIQSIGNRFLNYCNNLTKVNMGSITANIISDDVKMSSYYSFCCHYKTSIPCVTGLTLVGDDADAIRTKFPERALTESGWYRIWAS